MPLFGPNVATLKVRRDVAGLAQALKQKDTRLRRDVLRAFGELRDASAVPAILAVLAERDNALTEKIDAADALGKIGDAAARDALAQANTISRDRERVLIDAAIASSDGTYRDGFYVNRIAADEYELRAKIANALAQIPGLPTLATLFDLLATEKGMMESNVKSAIRAAIDLALEAAGEASVPLLCDLLKHTAEDVRACAVHCLSAFTTPSAEDALVGAACDEQESFAVRNAAIIALGNVGDLRGLPQLEALMQSSNQGIARDAKASVAAIRRRNNLPSWIVGF